MKTKNESAWVNNGSSSFPHYDFLPPKHWSNDRIILEQKKIINAIDQQNSKHSDKNLDAWLTLVIYLPNTLQSILSSELQHGNKVISISRGDWPNQNSIVVNVSDRFLDKSKRAFPNVHWRLLNDPHYCKEEISETINGVEHLLIC